MAPKLDLEARVTIRKLTERGVSATEIAEKLGVTEGAVRYHRRRQACEAADGRSRRVQSKAASHHEAIAALQLTHETLWCDGPQRVMRRGTADHEGGPETERGAASIPEVDRGAWLRVRSLAHAAIVQLARCSEEVVGDAVTVLVRCTKLRAVIAPTTRRLRGKSEIRASIRASDNVGKPSDQAEASRGAWLYAELHDERMLAVRNGLALLRSSYWKGMSAHERESFVVCCMAPYVATDEAVGDLVQFANFQHL